MLNLRSLRAHPLDQLALSDSIPSLPLLVLYLSPASRAAHFIFAGYPALKRRAITNRSLRGLIGLAVLRPP